MPPGCSKVEYGKLYLYSETSKLPPNQVLSNSEAKSCPEDKWTRARIQESDEHRVLQTLPFCRLYTTGTR